MISVRWMEVKEKLQTVLEMTMSERAAYLEELEAADPEMRREVESLLESHDQAGDTFMNAPAIDIAEPDARLSTMIGRRVGAYRIVEWIGAGGMGEVYRAARADEQFEKQVALKLVRGGPDSASVIGHFRKERQILAQLDHPNIARLLDGGTTEDGVPYFVMELIEGQPIDEYCAARGLSIAERLGLFRKVCSAVQYAHQLLIIHRDIKPGNILVTAEGTPKLLDFGIAKILTEDGEGKAADATMTAFAALTPGYASPEQVMGNPITTATDVYSLGVVLYELLTGRRPYRINSRAPQEIARAVCEAEPERPSVAVTRMERGEAGETAPAAAKIAATDSSAGKLRKRLKGDLDNIVLMALRKEPMRRYASVEQFSQDIERHLEHLPVIARNATLAYRTGKFLARYRTGVAAAILVALSLVAGMAISLHEARIARAERARAERRFNDVRNLSNTLLFKIDDSIKDLPGSTEARHLLISSAQQYLDSLSQEASGDKSLLRQLAEGYQKLGIIQGDSRGPSLGDAAAAVESLKKAVALREALVRANPGDRSALQELQKSYEAIADPLFALNVSEAAAYVEKSVKLSESLYRDDSSNPALLRALTLAYQDQAQVLIHRNDLAGATAVQTKSLELARQLTDKAPGSLSQTVLSYEHKRLGGLLIAQMQFPRALSEYQAAQSIDQTLLTAHPADASARYAITFDFSDMGYIEDKQGNYAAALLNYEKVLAIREALAKADPHDARAISGVARTCGYIGETLRDQNRPQQALRYDLRELAIWNQEMAHDANDRELRLEEGQANWNIGDDYLAIAKSERGGAERARTAQVARRYLLEAQAAVEDARNRGLLYGDLVNAPQEVAHDLAGCAALLKSPLSSASPDSQRAPGP
jgi:eukaryotic-like serine/threonine-protein kinase